MQKATNEAVRARILNGLKRGMPDDAAETIASHVIKHIDAGDVEFFNTPDGDIAYKLTRQGLLEHLTSPCPVLECLAEAGPEVTTTAPPTFLGKIFS